jgi:hypothetical protein
MYCLTQLLQTFEDENESTSFIKIQFLFSVGKENIAAERNSCCLVSYTLGTLCGQKTEF